MARFKWLSPKRETTRPSVVRGFSKREEAAYRRALAAITEARLHNISLSKAAKRHGTTTKTIRSYAGSAIDRQNGRLIAKRHDRMYRRMRIITPTGVKTVYIRGSRKAILAAMHYKMSIKYAEGKLTKDAFKRFKGKTVAGQQLESDPARAARIVYINSLAPDDLYDEVA